MSGPEYGFGARLLHRLALGVRLLTEASFDMEQATQRPDASQVGDARHVFVAGLARSGTTVLLRLLHASGAFRSLTYRDMPFVLMPGLWSRFSGRRRVERRERAHGDGLMVDVDSPEALDMAETILRRELSGWWPEPKTER